MIATLKTPVPRPRSARPFARLAALAALLVLGVVCLAGCDFIDNLNPYTTTSVEEAETAYIAAREPQLQAPDIVEDGVLTVGLITSEGAPSVFETQDGYAGIDVDVAAALASELGLSVKYVPLQDSATMALTPVDVVMGVANEQAGSAEGDSAPVASSGLVVASDYMEQAIGFFTLGEEPTVVSASELEGQTVGVQTASASERLLATSNLTMSTQGYENIDAAMDALAAGEVAYVLCPVYPGAFLANELGGISFCGTLNTPTMVGVGVSARSTVLTDAVQSAMSDVRDNGVLTIILSKWVGDLPRLTAASQISGVELADTTQTTTQSGTPGSNAVDSSALPEETTPEETDPNATTPEGTDVEGTGVEGEGESDSNAIVPL